MPRFFMKLSFKGTAYAGWQIQENAITVQEKLNTALTVLLRKEVTTTGCGRTDTGVHAKQFFVHFDIMDDIPEPDTMIHQLNAILPSDIAIQQFFRVANHHHSRYDASLRTYEYYLSPSKNPFLKEYTMYVHNLPDISIMNEACGHLMQKGDFSSFSKSNTQVKTNICHISQANWTTRNGLMIFTISADRFLRGMVRSIVGTMLDVGQGKIKADDVLEIIQKRDRSEAGVSVPACGLFLSRIDYPYIPVSVPDIFPA